jgi:hypothetical protein
MNTLAASPPTRAARRARRGLTVLAVTVAAVVVWLVAVPVAGVDLLVRSAGAEQPVGPVAVAVATLLAGLAGWALLALLERLTTRARGIWTGVAVAVLLLSLLGPLTEGVGAAAKATLVLLHLVGGLLVPALRRTAAGR